MLRLNLRAEVVLAVLRPAALCKAVAWCTEASEPAIMDS